MYGCRLGAASAAATALDRAEWGNLEDSSEVTVYDEWLSLEPEEEGGRECSGVTVAWRGPGVRSVIDETLTARGHEGSVAERD